MKFLIRLAGIAAVALIAAPAPVDAQAPIREGLRATGEAAAGVVEGAADVTRGVVQGTGQAAVGVAQGAADVTRGVIGGTARGVVAGVDALTPNIPLQGRAGATPQAGELGRDARWRFQQHNGEWWYYAPENAWMYHRDGQWNEFAENSFTPNPQFSGEYASGYRGPEGQPYAAGFNDGSADAGAYAGQGPVYQLHHDENGREYICDNGQRVYFDDGQGAAGTAGPSDQPTPAPALAEDPNASTGVDVQGGADASVTPQPPAGATPPQVGAAGATADVRVSAPATPTPPTASGQAGATGSGTIQIPQ